MNCCKPKQVTEFRVSSGDVTTSIKYNGLITNRDDLIDFLSMIIEHYGAEEEVDVVCIEGIKPSPLTEEEEIDLDEEEFMPECPECNKVMAKLKSTTSDNKTIYKCHKCFQHVFGR